MEKVPSEFSRALCKRTRPDFRTDIIIIRGFLLSECEFGGKGLDG